MREKNEEFLEISQIRWRTKDVENEGGGKQEQLTRNQVYHFK